MPAVRHHVNQFIRQILGMAGHEADAGDIQPVQFPQEPGEGGAARQTLAVAVHVLPQEHDLLHAAVAEFLRFPQDGLHIPAALPPAHIGHDAVGAEVVAAIHDGDVGRVLPQALHGHVLGDHVLLLHLYHGTVAVQRAAEQLRQLVQVGGAEGQIHKAVLLQDLLRHARLLNHAPAHGDHQPRIALAHLLEPGHIAKRPAFGIVTHTAGVENDKIRLLPVGSLLHAHLPQHARQLLAVMGVHLAAIGHHMIAAGPLGQLTHLRHKAALAKHLLRGDNDRLAFSHDFPPWGRGPHPDSGGTAASSRPPGAGGISSASSQSAPER